MRDPLELPPEAVLVHVGPFKTGTTSIQATLAACRPLLQEHGVDYSGTALGHHTAARALRQHRTGWHDDGTPPPSPAVWEDLVRHVNGVRGRVVISSEFLSDADDKERARLVRDLGADRVHVVAAARNPAAIAVSMWQQVLKEGYSVSIEDWLQRNLRGGSPEQPNGFWARVDPGVLAGRWAEAVGPDRVTVIVLDESDKLLLPQTFERLLGLPPGLLTERLSERTNRGLTDAEAALMQELNAAVKGRLSWEEYNRFVRSGMVFRILHTRRPGPDEAKPALPPWAAEQLHAASERGAQVLRSCGVRLVGDPDSLSRSRVPVGATTRRPEIPLELATEALVGAIAAGARGRWALDDPRGPVTGYRLVRETTTRELLGVLASRVRGGLRRRGRRIFSRGS